MKNANIDTSFLMQSADPGKFGEELAFRQRDLKAIAESESGADSWHLRSYPILAVLSPALSTHRNKIEFPGDPMCLYAALSVVIADAVKTKQLGLSSQAPFNDYCPRWGEYPSMDYRLSVSDNGIRRDSDMVAGNTDSTVFDPRIWDADVESYFRQLLVRQRPRVVLVSTVSPAYRYCAKIMQIVKEVLPNAVVVVGGRHMDETIQYEETSPVNVLFTPSSIVHDVQDGDLGPVVDVILSGESYDALSLVIKAISLAFPIDREVNDSRVDPKTIVNRLRSLSHRSSQLRGRCVITVMDGQVAHCFPVNGRPVDLSQLPSPYAPFAIRARFPVFIDGSSNEVCRTAHLNASRTCAFHCNFCSEARGVVPLAKGKQHDAENWVVGRMLLLASWAAEAIFFDDSILLSGSHHRIVDLCHQLIRARERLANGESGATLLSEHGFEVTSGQERLLARNLPLLQWGGQLTFGILESFEQAGFAERVLSLMCEAGCTYLYFGLESMSASIMAQIHKTRSSRNAGTWPERVRRMLSLVKDAGIRAGSSVLFGLNGETRETIDETIQGVQSLLEDGLLWIVSPNLMTYHPGTAITREHGTEDRLRLKNATLGEFIREPYSYFEEAFPGMVSRELNEELILLIHNETKKRWGTGRNMNPMKKVEFPIGDN